MPVTENDLKKIEQLAYLSSEPEENLKLAESINAMMDWAKQLQKVDTTKTAPLFHPMELHQRLRADEISEKDSCKALATIAALFEEGLYLVPKMIDSGQ